MLQVLTNVNIPTPPHPTQRSYVACGCVASSHERQHPHPTPPNPKKLRSMRMCCKFSRTSTSPPGAPHPTQRSYVACGCVASSHERQHPHPTPPNPKKLRFTKTLKTLARFSPRWLRHVLMASRIVKPVISVWSPCGLLVLCDRFLWFPDVSEFINFPTLLEWREETLQSTEHVYIYFQSYMGIRNLVILQTRRYIESYLAKLNISPT